MLFYLLQKFHSKINVPKYYKSKYHYVKKTDEISIVVYNTEVNFRIEKNTSGFPDINNSNFVWQPCTKDEFEFQALEVMRKTQMELCS